MNLTSNFIDVLYESYISKNSTDTQYISGSISKEYARYCEFSYTQATDRGVLRGWRGGGGSSVRF